MSLVPCRTMDFAPPMMRVVRTFETRLRMIRCFPPGLRVVRTFQGERLMVRALRRELRGCRREFCFSCLAAAVARRCREASVLG
jgi:hypothetical protein